MEACHPSFINKIRSLIDCFAADWKSDLVDEGLMARLESGNGIDGGFFEERLERETSGETAIESRIPLLNLQ